MVESDAPTIDSGWVMQGGETSATQGDRIIYDGDDANWILIASGSSNAGTVTGVTASLPLESDGDAVTPVISIVEARRPPLLILLAMVKVLTVQSIA